VTGIAGQTFGILGALAAFPRRLVARAVERQGGRLARGVPRRTAVVVLGRKLLARKERHEIEQRLVVEKNSGHRFISENGFLRLLGLAPAAGAGSGLARQALREQSRLSDNDLDHLSLFDAFERDREPYSFRDLILARKYAGLIAGGADWHAVARAIHRCDDIASLTAKSLEMEGRTVVSRQGDAVSELNGQLRLAFDASDELDADEAFARAEEAEAGHEYEEAVSLYGRCLAMDPSDAVAAFNRGNCFAALARLGEAEQDYLRAVKLDPSLVEGWFNLAGLMAERGRTGSARGHLSVAIALDPDYSDAIFNLARLEYDAERFAQARHWWARYLELDSTSEWAKTARRGIRYIDLRLSEKSAG
jgi:tetratricopeptide (TPR) repeat protein